MNQPPPLKPRAIRKVAPGVSPMVPLGFFVYPGHDPERTGLPPAATQGVRTADLARLAGPLLVLAAWAAGLAAHVLARRREATP